MSTKKASQVKMPQSSSNGGVSLCRQSETLVDLEKVADPAYKTAKAPECLYLTTLSSSPQGGIGGSRELSPERPRFDLNFEVLSKVKSDAPPYGLHFNPNPECKIYRARNSPFVHHLSVEDKERYLYHLGSIQDSDLPELKKEIQLKHKIEDLIGIKLDSLK
jgi:hypothetical protein